VKSETNSIDHTAINIISNLLECSIWLEERTAELYFKIANRAEQRNTVQILKIIAHQSKSHAEMLNWILETLTEKRRSHEIDCMKTVGEVGELTVDMIKTVEEKHTMTHEDLCKLLEKLEFIENGIGEETYSRILLPLIKTTIKQAYPETSTIEVAEEMIETIINEEKLHEKLVTLIGEITGCDAQANPSS
jgi:rubrerythrin